MSSPFTRSLRLFLEASSIVALVAATGAAQARDRTAAGAPPAEPFESLTRLSHDGSDIIFEMAPLRPTKLKSAAGAHPVAAPPHVAERPDSKMIEQAAQPSKPVARDAAVPKAPPSVASRPAVPHVAAQAPEVAAKSGSASEKSLESAARAPDAPLAAKSPEAPAAQPAAAVPTVIQPPQAAEAAAPVPAPASPAVEAAAPAVAAPVQDAPPAVSAEAPAPTLAAETPVAAAPEPAPAPIVAAPAVVPQPQSAAIEALRDAAPKGPVEVRVAGRATLWLPAGHAFVAGPAAQGILEQAGQSWDANVEGVVLPASGPMDWFATVEAFSDGLVRDDEAHALDPVAITADYQNGFPALNAARTARGARPIEFGGWSAQPVWDAEKRVLSACSAFSAQGSDDPRDRYFNCGAYVLGRKGALKVNLTAPAAQFQRLKGKAAELAGVIVHDRGETYTDVVAGKDAVAAYGIVDLLASDISGRTHAIVERPKAPEAAEDGGVLDVVADHWMELAAALIILGALLLRSKNARKPAAADAADAEEIGPEVVAEAPPKKSVLAGAIAAVRQSRSSAAAESEAVVAQVEANPTAAASSPSPARGSLIGGLMAKFRKSLPAETEPADNDDVVAAAERQSSSVLRELARKMRKAEPEAPAAPASAARVQRAIRLPSGAAEAPDDLPATADEEFALIEPGEARKARVVNS